MKKLSKTEARQEVEEFFKNIRDKTPKEIKKIKKFAMNYNLPLKGKRKLFCKKCFHPLGESKVRIKKGMKIIECRTCGHVGRWKINSS